MRLASKQKAILRIRRYARLSADARLGGHMEKARQWDDLVERVYAEAKRAGWSEGPFVKAEEKGREEAHRYKDWFGAQDRVYGRGRQGRWPRAGRDRRRSSKRRSRRRR